MKKISNLPRITGTDIIEAEMYQNASGITDPSGDANTPATTTSTTGGIHLTQDQINAGIAAGTALLQSLTSGSSNPAAESVCGKEPFFPGARKNAWKECYKRWVDNQLTAQKIANDQAQYNLQHPQQPTPPDNRNVNTNPPPVPVSVSHVGRNIAIVSGSVLLVGGIIFAAWKLSSGGNKAGK